MNSLLMILHAYQITHITYRQSAIHCCYFAFWVICNFLLLLGSHIIINVVHLFVLHPWLFLPNYYVFVLLQTDGRAGSYVEVEEKIR